MGKADPFPHQQDNGERDYPCSPTTTSPGPHEKVPGSSALAGQENEPYCDGMETCKFQRNGWLPDII